MWHPLRDEPRVLADMLINETLLHATLCLIPYNLYPKAIVRKTAEITFLPSSLFGPGHKKQTPCRISFIVSCCYFLWSVAEFINMQTSSYAEMQTKNYLPIFHSQRDSGITVSPRSQRIQLLQKDCTFIISQNVFLWQFIIHGHKINILYLQLNKILYWICDGPLIKSIN